MGHGAPGVGTLRAGDEKNQIRKEQSRWKIGTAVLWGRKRKKDVSSVERWSGGSVQRIAAGTAIRSMPLEGH